MSLVAARNIALFVILGTPLAMPAQGTKGGATPPAAVQEFIRALADSNLTRMAELFGNDKGPVSKSKPQGYEKKIVVMQIVLHGIKATTLGDVPGKKGMRTITTQLTNHGCKVTIPVDVVKAPEGWLVWDFDLTAAEEVNKPCDATRRPGTGGE